MEKNLMAKWRGSHAKNVSVCEVKSIWVDVKSENIPRSQN